MKSEEEEEEENRGEDDDVWIAMRKNSKNTDLHCRETGFEAIGLILILILILVLDYGILI